MKIDYDKAIDKFLVTFPYHNVPLTFVQGAPQRLWNAFKRAWTLPATALNAEYIRGYPHGADMTIVARDRFDLIDADAMETEEYLSKLETGNYEKKKLLDHVPKTKPFGHQIEGFNLARDRKSFALFFEQGLGKTKTTIDLADYMFDKNQIERVLVLCPAFVKPVWVREILQHSTHNFPVYVINGSDGKRREAKFKASWEQEKCWIITNYEEIITESVGFEFLIVLRKWKTFIVADESTRLKNRATRTSKQAAKLSKKATKILALSGAPITNNPLDLWAQARFLHVDTGFSTYKAFENRYALMGGYGNYQVVQWMNMDELKMKIKGFSLRRTKEECLDLPEKVYQRMDIELPHDLQKLYNKFKKTAYLELTEEAASRGGEITSTSVLTKILRLSQIVGGTLKMEDGEITRMKQQPKMDALFEFLDNLEKDPYGRLQRSVIVWAWFREEIKMLGEELKKRGYDYSINYGATKLDARTENVERFQRGEDRVFVGQSRAVGMGITLTAASYVVYYSNNYSYEVRVQSEDRAHRIGQDKNVTYIDLVAKDTVDEHVLKALKSKKSLAEWIIDDKMAVLQ